MVPKDPQLYRACGAPFGRQTDSIGLKSNHFPLILTPPNPPILNPPNIVPICKKGEVLLLGGGGV